MVYAFYLVKENKVCDFLFVSLDIKSFQNMLQLK